VLNIRMLDIAVVIAILPIALLLGAPAVGCIVATVVWIVQRVVAGVVDGRARAQHDPRSALKLNFVAMMARVWLICLAIVLCGVLVDRSDGAAAAATMLVAFTVYLAVTLLTRTTDRKSVHA
jgi:L-asparagine transporter-like permease